MKLLTVAFFCSGAALFAAQDSAPKPPKPEIRGLVIEPGTANPIPDVDVTLVRLPMTGPRIVSTAIKPDIIDVTKTDATGAFSFSVDKMGDYRVEAYKEGFRTDSPTGSSVTVTLDDDHPRREVKFLLTHPGELSGRVLDEETHKPLPKVSVHAATLRYSHGRPIAFPAGAATTDIEGRFTITGLQPGKYIVRVWSHLYSQAEGQARPEACEHGLERISTNFSEDDLKTVDWDYEPSWWPGGAGLDSAYPMLLTSGTSLSFGDVLARKKPAYSVRVSVASTCGPKDTVKWDVVPLTVAQTFSEAGSAPCGKDILLRGLLPGRYRLEAAMLGGTRETREKGSAGFEVVDKNISVSVPIARGIDIDGKIVLADGAGKPDFKTIGLRLSPIGWAPFGGEEVNPISTEGRYRIVNVAARDQRLFVDGLANPYYVKQVLYNSHPLSDNVLPVDAYAMAHGLEIVIDDKPATLSGTATQSDNPVAQPYVVLVRWPANTLDPYFSEISTTGDDNGRFQFSGLAPGEYRLFAVLGSAKYRLEEPHVLDRLLGDAAKVTLSERNAQNVTCELKEIR